MVSSLFFTIARSLCSALLCLLKVSKSFQDIQSKLHDMQPDVDNISSICVQLDENFDNEEMSLNELKQKAVDLEEDHAEQLRLLADFIEK